MYYPTKSDFKAPTTVIERIAQNLANAYSERVAILYKDGRQKTYSLGNNDLALDALIADGIYDSYEWVEPQDNRVTWEEVNGKMIAFIDGLEVDYTHPTFYKYGNFKAFQIRTLINKIRKHEKKEAKLEQQQLILENFENPRIAVLQSKFEDYYQA